MKFAVDSSVIIAGFATWHESHDAAREALDKAPLLVAHCALEAYSVLTRLPSPFRVAPDVVAAFLRARFPKRPLILPVAVQSALVPHLVKAGVSGGAVYDAYVGMTASHHKATLLTLDVRAQPTYTRVAVRFRALT